MKIDVSLRKDGSFLQLQDVPEETALKVIEGFYRGVKGSVDTDKQSVSKRERQAIHMNQLIKNEKGETIPAFWKTGIKEDLDGTKRYKCRYSCECGNDGNHYIPLGTDDVECHKCNYPIAVEPAGKVNSDGVPKRDTFGNFFTARANN